ncbi:peptidase S8/S53 domain-containing protein, partial [Triangularia verruculosa]
PSTVPSLANEYLVQFHANISHEVFRAHTAAIHADVQRYSSGNEQYGGVLRHFSIGSGFRAFHGHLNPRHVEQLRQLDVVGYSQGTRLLQHQNPRQRRRERVSLPTTHPSPPVNKTLTNPPPRGQSRLSHRLPNSASEYRYIKPPPSPQQSTCSTQASAQPTPNSTLPSTHPPTPPPSPPKSASAPNFTVPPSHPDRFNSTDLHGHGTHTAGTNNLTSNMSPASCPDAITVAATDRNDTRAGFSSYGPEVDIFAPGVGILSAAYGDDHASVYMDGTSMAAPHVAGLAAYFMMMYGAHTPEEMRERLLDAAVKGVVKDKGEGSTDALAYNGV